MDSSESRGARPWNMNTNTYDPVPRASVDIATTRSSPPEDSISYEALKKEPRVSYTSRTSSSIREPPSTRSSLAAWGLELFAVSVSLASIIAIVAVLYHENGKPLTVWKFALTLNTIIAVLGTLARTTLAFALSSCVGQQKWTWLRRKTDRLVAFERFDEASRGPWGATRLFFWLRVRHWAALGALVIMGTVAFDPFLQAILTTYGQLNELPSHGLSSRNASTIAQALRVDSGTISGIPSSGQLNFKTKAGMLSILGGTQSRPDLGIVSAINDGFHVASAYRANPPSTDCVTGNCTWTTFSSAAICSACNDVSNEMKAIKGVGTNVPQVPMPTNVRVNANYTTFNLPYLNITNYDLYTGNTSTFTFDLSGRTYMTMNMTTDPRQTVSFQELETLLAAFAIFKASDDWTEGKVKWNETKPIATECALYMCANAYQSQSENGVLSEKLTGSWATKDSKSYRPDPGSKAFTQGSAVEAWADEHEHELYDRNVPRLDLRILIPAEESKGFPEDMARSFNVSYSFIRSTTEALIKFASSGDSEVTVRGYSYFPDQYFTPAIETLWSSENITQKFEDIALSLSNSIRNTGARFEGTTQQWTIHMRVRWEFLALPVAVLAGGIIYVVLTIVESIRLQVPVWKENALPTLLHGFNNETQHLLREAHAGSKGGASSTSVRFTHDEKGDMRLVTG